MLSRKQFESAAQAFARRHPHWAWVPGHRPGYGYLSRTTSHFRKASPEVEDLASDVLDVENDPATAHSARPALNVQEHILYSASFNVPAFYFNIHEPNGTPLPLVDLVRTTLFKISPPEGSVTTDFALILPSAPFPLLSQGDHPTLDTPCWYFHPCESATAVNEFMAEVEQPDWDEETRLVRWLELWIMIVGGIINL
ncbi:unnamed protein product [Cyclocybe aegerita]|uniref:Ubiquitin-like-conjugating enzyme ATG10 n=1 Tax=Cyclocybe aegerita TaxID=1973307 RepID=A0A8S0WVE4_CYCAE|nr:unnamed protein product [Cyclocybe aegerita]